MLFVHIHHFRCAFNPLGFAKTAKVSKKFKKTSFLISTFSYIFTLIQLRFNYFQMGILGTRKKSAP